jgi:DNA modification methylase
MFSNHTQIINFFTDKGYSVLPDIIWRKQSNSPNKFMGSGMYPAGAYVTYEHEYILIFRKGNKRDFKGKEKDLRQKSAYFWEERNVWFSDLWEIKGTSQVMTETPKKRNRNASFPLEIPLRLIYMYSVEGDIVLDPFAGLGTTNIACMISNRNSVGIEIDSDIAKIALINLNQNTANLNYIIRKRIEQHLSFISNLPKEKIEECYTNSPHGFPVKTKQETKMEIEIIDQLKKSGNTFVCNYKKYVPEPKYIQMTLME